VGERRQGSSVEETKALMKPWKEQNRVEDVKSWKVERGGAKITLSTGGGRKRKWE